MSKLIFQQNRVRLHTALRNQRLLQGIKISFWTNVIRIANSIDQCLVKNLWAILGYIVKSVKPRLSKIQSLKKTECQRILITTCQKILMKTSKNLTALYVQSDTGCNKGQRPTSCITFTKPPILGFDPPIETVNLIKAGGSESMYRSPPPLRK